MPTDRKLRKTVFKFAITGNLKRLKALLDQQSRAKVIRLISASTNGVTPLIISCKFGHKYVVKYLLEHCNADVNHTATITMYGETVKEASPLWCAAAVGHIKIVELLVKFGASVNAVTKSNSTPLRAACFDNHFRVVKYLVEHGADVEIANSHGHTCLMIASHKGHLKIAQFLIKAKANVNRESIYGDTALHECADSGSLEITKLLLANGAKIDVRAHGMTPLLNAAVNGHKHIVEHLMTNSKSMTRQERIDALELLGAAFINEKHDMVGSLILWKQSVHERYIDGELVCHKILPVSPIATLENTAEFSNIEQLENIIPNEDEMRVQALLVFERILGPAHPKTSYYILYRGAVYSRRNDFARCITLWMYVLQMLHKTLVPLNPMTVSLLSSFAELFSHMIEFPNHPTVELSDIMSVFKIAMTQISQFSYIDNPNFNSLPERDATGYDKTLFINLHFIRLITQLLPHLAIEEIHQVRKTIYEFIKLDARDQRGRTLLHLACSNDESNVVEYYLSSQFPSADVVSILLKCGADIEAQDNEGNFALHTAAINELPAEHPIARILLENGAHFDAVNADKCTFADLITPWQPIDKVFNVLKFTNLKCLAATVITRHNIPHAGILPTKLSHLVKLH